MGLQASHQAPRTSQPHPGHKICPYPLKNLAITMADQVWCADASSVAMRCSVLYRLAIMGRTTRKVLTWKLSNITHMRFLR